MAESKQKTAFGVHLPDVHKTKGQETNLDKADSYNEPCAITEEKSRSSKSGKDKTYNAKRMDPETLQKKTAQFVEFREKIAQLQDTLSEKNEVIEAMRTQIKVLQEGTGDNPNIGPGHENDKKMLTELRMQVESRNIQIGQLVESLKSRSEELEDALNREKELKHDIRSLQEDIEKKAKESEAKLNEYYNTAVACKAKMELQERRNQDHSNSLTHTIQNNNRNLEAQEELLRKYSKLEKDKNDAVADIQNLMKQIEELNHNVVSRETELKTSKQQLERLRKEMDQTVKIQIEALKYELEEKYKEDVKNVELMYDNMMLKQIRKFKSDIQLKEIDNNIENDINACKKICEQRNSAYLDELQNLMEKSKFTEEQLKCELNKHKQEVIYYKQQVENFENKLFEEVEKIKHDCYSQINKMELKMNTSNESFDQSHQLYQEEIDRLAVQLREYAKNEALKEEEIEMYSEQCKKQDQQIKALIENLEEYKRVYEELRQKVLLLEKDLNDKHSQLQFVTHELNIERIRNEEYEEQVRCFNNKIKADSDNFHEKCQAFVQTYEKEIEKLKEDIEYNKASYSQNILLWKEKSNDMQDKIIRLEQELSVVLRKNATREPESKDNNAVHDTCESYRQFLLNLASGLYRVMADIRHLTKAKKYCEYDQIYKQISDVENLDCENLKQVIEKVMSDLLGVMKDIALSFDGAMSFGTLSKARHPLDVVTSTPIRKELANGLDEDLDTVQTSSNESVDNWMIKCAQLECENERLANETKLLSKNLKEMEICLTIVTQESFSFNNKCKELDVKITELEQTKLSEFVLRKENNALKEQLEVLETDQKKLHQELKLLNENNIKLEKLFNKNIIDLQNKIGQSEDNEEMQGILFNLKQKSEELIRLKSELATLRLSEENQKIMTQDIKLKHRQFVAKHEFLSIELESRTNELKEIWEQRNKLSSDNKVLTSKLISAGLITSETVVEGENASGKNKDNERGLHPLSNGSNISYNEEHGQTLNSNNINKNYSENIPSGLSVVERIGYQLQQLDQDLIDPLNYHMPTIPEEAEDQLESSSQQPQVQMLSSVQCSLHQLLRALTKQYTSQVKALLPPLLGDSGVLDFNLLRDIDCILSKSTGPYLKSSNVSASEKGAGDSINEHSSLSLASDAAKTLVEFCAVPLFHLRQRITLAHNAVLTTILGHRHQLEQADLTVDLQKQVGHLKEQIDLLHAQKDDLEEKHSLAIELLVKDHENELGIVKNLLADLQVNVHLRPKPEEPQELESLKKKHHREMEDLRTYFEKKCSDMEKQYSEEMYSQSQQSCKISMSSSSSDISNMADLGPAPDLHLLNHLDGESEPQQSQTLCRLCSRGLASGDNQAGDNASDVSRELELKVYQLKEEVRKDYESELEKIREEIISKELKRKDEEIEVMKRQLNEAHKVEVEKLWRQYEELAAKEGEKSLIRVRNETILSQELEEKTRLIEQLRADKMEFVNKLKITDHLKTELNLVKKTHQKEIDTMKKAFEIELTTRLETIQGEKTEMEGKFKKLVEKLQQDIKAMSLERVNYQDNQEHKLHDLTETVRKDVLRSLELQIKAIVASGEEGSAVSQWPPELAALERQLSIRYQNQLTQMVEEHALEVADIRADYEGKLAELVKEHAMDQAENTQLAIPGHFSEDQDIDKIVKERDGLRGLALTLRQVVCELTTYLTSCEDELNRSIVGELLKLASPRKVSKPSGDSESSESDSDQPDRRVHFAPDVSGLVSLLADDTVMLDISCADVSIVLRSELETCLARLKAEAGAVLGLTQGRDRASSLPLGIEERRLTSLTRQLIDERKTKEEISRELQDLHEAYDRCTKELNDVYKELAETKERFMKEKVTEEAENNEREQGENIQNLCFLQEKARALLSEKEDCPPQWLGLIEELCAMGDRLIEEACRARDDLYQQVEAADKQLRSTRTFLEEQASEREQERDDFARDLASLREQLRSRDNERTNHREFAREVEALELQLKESTELLKDSEENKEKIEKELKAAVEKIWVLRDIISELEAAVAMRADREVTLQTQVLQLESELQAAREQPAGAQQDQQGSGDQRSSPQPPSPRAISNVKAQLRGLVRSLEQQVRELEAVNVHASSASLSSPSEDVSIREHLEALRCVTPDGKLSPSTCGPLEELSQVGDKLLRYRRAADTIVKAMRDRDLHINMLNTRSEELQAERDVLHAQNEKQLLQMASLRERLEGVRARAEKDSQAHTAPLLNRLREMETREASLTDQLNDANRKLNKLKQKLDRSESLVRSQEAELSSVTEQQHQLVLRLSHDLDTMRAEKQQLQVVVEKYRSEGNVSFPQLIDVMLAEKNADIDQLQHRVEELQSQRDITKNHQSRNARVSFADDISNSRPMEVDRARDASAVQSHDFRPFFSTPFSSVQDEVNKLVPRLIGEDLSKVPEPSIANLSTSPNRAFQLERALSQLKAELEEKTQRLVECEAKLAETQVEIEEAKTQYAQQTDQLAQVEAELGKREEEIARTKADLRAVQLIMEGLQIKLSEARAFTMSPATQGEDNEKLLIEERSAKQALQKAVVSLEHEKQKLSSDLATTRAKCNALQHQLTAALEKSEHSEREIGLIRSQLEAATGENTRLDNDCKQLKRDMERMSKKQRTELKNIVSKDANEAKKLKDEIELLKSSNAELRAECETLQRELDEFGSKLHLLRDIEVKDEKIEKLQQDLRKLDDSNKILKEEKSKTERSLNDEISELKVLIDDLNKNVVSLESEPKEFKVETLSRRFEMLKRECERQRRGRKECERKCSGLKEELVKEKQYSASLQNGPVEKRVPCLGITKANIVDIKSEVPGLANSLDDLTDEVQKELNASARLDQSLISGLQATNEEKPVTGQGRGPGAQVEYLTRRLAEVETELHVEKVVVSELRGRLARERALHVEQRSRADKLASDVNSLHDLNDQLEHKFKGIVNQLEQQVNEVKELRLNAGPSPGTSLKEKEELKKLVRDKQRIVDDLMRERTFTKNQLLYLREEVARLTNERVERPAEPTNNDQERVQQGFESERRKSAALKDALDQVEDLRLKLTRDVEIRKSLEAKIKAMELAEKSRYSRRKSIEERLRTLVEETEKAKKGAENECSQLRIQLKQLQLQLTAHSAESPLVLRLREANMAVERLVGEKEDLNSANVLLREEKTQLARRVCELSDQVEQLKSHIDALNIKVTDGGSDKLLKAERAAWQQERETLLRALSFRPQYNDSFNDIAHILQRYLRADSDRTALVWQKRYLLVALRGYQDLEQGAICTLAPFATNTNPTKQTPAQKLRVAVCAARAVSRLQFLVRHRRRSRANSCRLLHHALTANQHKVDSPADVQTLWRNSGNISSSSSLQPGTMAQYIDQFNLMQERMKNILSSKS